MPRGPGTQAEQCVSMQSHPRVSPIHYPPYRMVCQMRSPAGQLTGGSALWLRGSPCADRVAPPAPVGVLAAPELRREQRWGSGHARATESQGHTGQATTDPSHLGSCVELWGGLAGSVNDGGRTQCGLAGGWSGQRARQWSGWPCGAPTGPQWRPEMRWALLDMWDATA